LGDGLATSLASLFGGPPNTTYSEVTGAVMLTKMFNPRIMLWAAAFAIGLAFVAKFGIALQTIPSPVMGGILILLFGSIAGVAIGNDDFSLTGISLCGIVAILLNAVLPQTQLEEEKINE
jgi:uracil permease